MANEIKVNTVLTAGDFQEFNLWFSTNSRIILNAFSVVAYTAAMLAVTKDYTPVSLTILAVSAALLAAVLWFITKSSISKKSKKAFESDSLAQQAQNYTLSDDGLQYESESGSGQVKWADMHKVNETANLFVLFVSSNRALIVPKRFFQDAGDVDAFKDLARKHMFSSRVKFKM